MPGAWLHNTTSAHAHTAPWLAKHFDSCVSPQGLDLLVLTDMPCTAAQRRPQRPPRLHTKRRASLWSAARASGSLAMRKSLCRKWTSAFGIRTSGLCRSAPIESAWLSCGISPSGGKKIGDTNWLGPASCAWTMRRSEACLYRPISLLMSPLLWKLAPRRKAPFQLADRCWPASLALAAASQLGAPIQTSASDADGATPEEALRELAPDSDTRSIDKQGNAHERCLCPPEDWLVNRERALANGCPAWIQHVADAASVLLCHAYELSRGVECRFEK